jgi:hypothetical protein
MVLHNINLVRISALKFRFPDSKIYEDWEKVPLKAKGYMQYVKYSFQTAPFISMVIETFWNKNMFIKKDMIYSSTVISSYFILNIILALCGKIVYVPIDFKSWWTSLYLFIYLLIATFSIVAPIWVNNWWSREITTSQVFFFQGW